MKNPPATTGGSFMKYYELIVAQELQLFHPGRETKSEKIELRDYQEELLEQLIYFCLHYPHILSQVPTEAIKSLIEAWVRQEFIPRVSFKLSKQYSQEFIDAGIPDTQSETNTEIDERFSHYSNQIYYYCDPPQDWE